MSSSGQQQQQEEEEPGTRSSWQHQSQTAGGSISSSAAGTPIRCRTDNKSSARLSEFIPAGGQQQQQGQPTSSSSTSESSWRHHHLPSSPSRLQQGQSSRLSSSQLHHCWSSESLLMPGLDPNSGQQLQLPAQQAPPPPPPPPEPFIPPPPLLDFETANLLPPLGVDVSSPSDDLHFSSAGGGGAPDHGPDGKAPGGVNWVQVPPQYATLRRPRAAGNNPAVRSGPSGGGPGEGYSTLRRPRSSSQQQQQQPSWLLDADHQHHLSDSGSSGCMAGRDGIRKCTCGQKMRLPSSGPALGHHHPHHSTGSGQQQQQPGESHSRSDDGLAGIATLRRPVKRKTRSQIPSQMMTGNQSGGPDPVTVPMARDPGMAGAASAGAGSAGSALPKLETSVLLDKLLRAGALRPEDYLVLSRMERMIMANHVSAGQQQQQPLQPPPPVSSSRVRQATKGGLSATSPADSGVVDMRREFELNAASSAKMNISAGQLSSENLYDTQSSLNYPRRSSASSDRTSLLPAGMQQQPSAIASSTSSIRSERPSPGPMDYYYGATGGGGRSDPSGGFHQQQRTSEPYQQQPSSLYGPAVVPTAGRCCPCCGSPSHPQQLAQHHACNLCGGGPHQQPYYPSYSSGPKQLAVQQQPPPPTYSSAVTAGAYGSSSARHYSAGSDMLTMGTKYQPSGMAPSSAVQQSQQQHPLKNPSGSSGGSGSVTSQQHLLRTTEPGMQAPPPHDPLRFTMAPNGAQQQQLQQLGPSLHRSISTPARSLQQQQSVQPSNASSSAATVAADSLAHRGAVGPGNRVGLSRSLSRTEAVKEYFKQSAATFFGLDESRESELRQRWEDRRRRLAERRCGTLREASLHEENVESRDLVDGASGEGGESSDGVCGLVEGPSGSTSASQLLLQHHHRRLRRRDSVARMTWDGLAYLATAVVRLRAPGAQEEAPRSRSISATNNATALPGLTASRQRIDTAGSSGAAAAAAPMPPDVTMDTGGTANLAADTALDDEVFFDVPPPPYEDVVDAPQSMAATQPASYRYDAEPRSARWRRAVQSPPTAPASASLVDRLMDNSNRRQYGMGVVGRLTRRSLRQSMVENNKHLKSQLDSFEDHRPYFTYWTCTVQFLIMLIALITYGLGPIGFNLHRRSGSVLVTSLSLQEVDYYEPSNFWIGPRAADLIHLGAKYSPCMKPDTRIRADIEATRIRERQTACCIRNDNSGCVQTSRAECSDLTSTWKKWNVVQSGPGGRISGSVCGQDPNFCIEPASVAPFEWPDDITKWPKCRKKLPGLGSESKTNANHVLKTTGHAEHMVCEVIGHPCCIGIHGDCRIATREYCDFVKGYFHQEASLCSQVSCMNDVCGMLPFHTPDLPDQFYRLWTSLFLHAGILHLAVSIIFQMVIMRDLEKLAGPLRIGIIYLGSGVVGNLASALFVPYRAEVGPSGSHFGLLACLCVEVLHAWPLLRTPWRALGRLLLTVAFLFLAGLLPWVDNFAHIFGFISGGLLSYTFLPFITVGVYDRRRKLVLIGVTLTLCAVLLTTLVLLLYVWPIQDSGVIQTLGYLNCVPITRDFCAEQNIHFNKREISIT